MDYYWVYVNGRNIYVIIQKHFVLEYVLVFTFIIDFDLYLDPWPCIKRPQATPFSLQLAMLSLETRTM